MLAPNILKDPEAISTKDPDHTCFEYPEGSVLLTFDGRIMKLNSVGSLVWELLSSQQYAGGVAESNLLAFVNERLDLLQTSSNKDLLGNDLKHFLLALTNRRLISVSVHSNGTSVFNIMKDTVWSGRLRCHSSYARANTVTTPVNEETDRNRLMTLRALSWFLIYSFLLRTGGFRSVRRIVERKSRQLKLRDQNSEREICFQICNAVDRAQTYLLRHALCLQRSIVITRLLQNYGIGAETVIAAHLMPFKSHAWVEIDGEVVSDSPNVKRYYDVVVERLGYSR
jgi:hypothetical protein